MPKNKKYTPDTQPRNFQGKYVPTGKHDKVAKLVPGYRGTKVVQGVPGAEKPPKEMPPKKSQKPSEGIKPVRHEPKGLTVGFDPRGRRL